MNLRIVLQKGHMVVDLGAGAGLDAFAARSQVGDTGRVIGIDFTEEMVRKARTNNQKLGYGNVEFKLGDIENLPLPDAIADVVISNCVLNLVPDKGKAFREIHRILKPGGHFCISDIVSKTKFPAAIRESAELYAGCIAGAIPEKDYIEIIRRIGFKSIEINQSKHIQLSEILLSTHLPPNKVKNWDQHEFGLFSITVSGYKVGIAQ